MRSLDIPILTNFLTWIRKHRGARKYVTEYFGFSNLYNFILQGETKVRLHLWAYETVYSNIIIYYYLIFHTKNYKNIFVLPCIRKTILMSRSMHSIHVRKWIVTAFLDLDTSHLEPKQWEEDHRYEYLESYPLEEVLEFNAWSESFLSCLNLVPRLPNVTGVDLPHERQVARQ